MAEQLDKAKQTGQGAIKGAVGDKAGKAEALIKGGLNNAFNGGAEAIKGILNGLKDSLGIPDLPKIPKKPAFPELKKFKPKKPPQPKIYQKEEKKFDYAPAPTVQKPTPKPAPPRGKLSYKYEWDGKRIGVGFYEGDRYVDAIGAINFKGKITEERAVELFIQNYKAEQPNLESWGMQKLSK
ncbi:MAG: hypothetical protein EBS55_10255 [Flavobacteriaceae bacterium]|nr:hypothetical protein [Flavobacteriaceae bacterium]